MQREDHMHTYTDINSHQKLFFFSPFCLCFQGTSSCAFVRSVDVWASREREDVGWHGKVWFSRWHVGSTCCCPLPITAYQKTPAPAKRIISWPKNTGSSWLTIFFFWQWQTAKAICRQCSNQLLVQKGSFRQSHNYYGPSIHIFVWGHHNFHTGPVHNVIALWFKLQHGLCWTDLIIVQCSKTLTGNYPVGQVIYLFNNDAAMAMTFVSLRANVLSF